MWSLATPWWAFVVRSVVVYLSLLIGLRLFGKRELGQMTPFDLIVILLVANALQNAMVGLDTSVSGGLIAAATLLVINSAVARIRRRYPFVRRLAEGAPVLLVHGGRVLEDQLEREGVDRAELEQAAREHGLASLDTVDQAVLEVDGTVSIIPKTGDRLRTARKVSRGKAVR